MPISPYWWFIALYSLSLLFIGWYAARRSQESSLKDYYLAGSSLGPVALFFTLYATNYSGGSLFGIPGKAYSTGLEVAPMLVGLTGVGFVLLAYAPKLYRIAQRQQFLTLGDFIHWRYQYRPLLWLVNGLAVFSLTAYVLSNLLAVGLLLETASGGHISFAMGVITVSIIMAVYESLGGMRSVVWSDIIQGSLLLIGALVACVLAFMFEPKAIPALVQSLSEQHQKLTSGEFPVVSFISLSIVITFAACVYPQKIQRIYAAKNLATTLTAYKVMLFMPLITLLPLILVSMSAPAWIPGLEGRDTERVMLYVIASLEQHIDGARILLTIYLAAGVAAIMSTIDSALLTMGSMITHDGIRPKYPQMSQQNLQRLGKWLSWGLMVPMVTAAIVLPSSVWGVLVFMLEMMLQLSPAVLLGVWLPQLRGRPMFVGMLLGLVVTLSLKFIEGWGMPLQIHSGLWGVMVNLLVIFVGSMMARRASPSTSPNTSRGQ
ncbi:MAG: Na+/proline symporter [Oceanicoccus sp.]|jgi:Na+/proline symporter